MVVTFINQLIISKDFNIWDTLKLDNPDNKFLRFEKDLLSNSYTDKVNYPSLKSCMLRVQGTLNSNCLTKGLNNEESKVNYYDNQFKE